MITKDYFDKTDDGRIVDAITLDNGTIKAVILNYGGIIQSLYVPAKDGSIKDVVLGADTIKDYKNDAQYFGALIGRVGNRIMDGRFTLNGVDYQISINSKTCALHGGKAGFDSRIWNVDSLEEVDGEPTLVLSYVSADGEEGFPGELKVVVTYKITKDNALSIHYEAETNKDTLCNLTNHAFFNLEGHDYGDIKDTILCLKSSFFTPNGDDVMPHGEIWSVDGTPFDFRTPKTIGKDIDANYEQIEMFGGYDHNLLFDGTGMRSVGYAEAPNSGIKMEIITDQAGVQLYTSGHIDNFKLKGGATYQKYQAFCLETQDIPNAISHPHYKAPILRKGEKYDTTTIYRFS